MPYSVWRSWCTKGLLGEEETSSYKATVEEINENLSLLGRALGHRVWQSIDYYIASHPLVMAKGTTKEDRAKAIKDAFEDQLKTS